MEFNNTQVMIAIISGFFLIIAGVLSGFFNFLAGKAGARRSDKQSLMDELNYQRNIVTGLRQELLNCEAEKKVLNQQLDAERVTCKQQINELREELEGFKQTISRLRTELGLGPEH